MKQRQEARRPGCVGRILVDLLGAQDRVRMTNGFPRGRRRIRSRGFGSTIGPVTTRYRSGRLSGIHPPVRNSMAPPQPGGRRRGAPEACTAEHRLLLGDPGPTDAATFFSGFFEPGLGESTRGLERSGGGVPAGARSEADLPGALGSVVDPPIAWRSSGVGVQFSGQKIRNTGCSPISRKAAGARCRTPGGRVEQVRAPRSRNPAANSQGAAGGLDRAQSARSPSTSAPPAAAGPTAHAERPWRRTR